MARQLTAHAAVLQIMAAAGAVTAVHRTVRRAMVAIRRVDIPQEVIPQAATAAAGVIPEADTDNLVGGVWYTK